MNSTKIINGKEISLKIKDKIKEDITLIKKNKKIIPKLVVIVIGENPSSRTYVKNKQKACDYVGMKSEIISFKETIEEKILLEKIEKLNNDNLVDGILVQLPLPKHISTQIVISTISPNKDVDGFHPENISKLFLGEKGFIPCTPKGVVTLLDYINYDLTGKNVVIVGRSNIVGKPLSLLCLQRNATVTIAHSKSENLKEICKKADVLITAIGKVKFFNSEYIKEDAIVIDVGINRDENNKLCGDVDFEDVYEKALAITPVPGGVGPMTIASLLSNTMISYWEKEGGLTL